ncbi:hypothetical protein [Alkaliphilus serpentinus]|uniref:Uncharacterized protein n=1 Tax=Alkaliphilus serpentinus TaxID=1482731 RepID=A0A833HLK2_9FIRM|nr:hypothetical protein [Alkaliphilus serpentinus]KAB3525922.1 hypothetical protein F8153_14410 [Alkaliphilus serpentinus]
MTLLVLIVALSIFFSACGSKEKSRGNNSNENAPSIEYYSSIDEDGLITISDDVFKAVNQREYIKFQDGEHATYSFIYWHDYHIIS